jgi:hypothetical protein
MKKVLTIFERNWESNKKVNEKIIVDFDFKNSVATEKLNGTNVRVTIRNHQLVRLEKRRNPSKIQKCKGISNPWYIDANENSPEDKYIYDAARNTDYNEIEDGEYSGEAVGEKIQGNTLNLIGHTIFLFSIPNIVKKIIFDNVPVTYKELKEWLPKQKSKFGNNCQIEGIVWHNKNGEMVKIKTNDF